MNNIIRLPLEQAFNVRELGGYAGNNRQSTKWQRFLRGDDLSKLSEQDLAYLKAYGVVVDIDLRSSSECSTHPDCLSGVAGIQYINIPFMTREIDDVTKLDIATKNFNLSDFYLTLLKEQDIVCRLMKTIAEAPNGCILFHCTAGKDRTGILSMLLLGLAGVCKTDILTNYQMSYINLLGNPNRQFLSIPKDMEISCMYSKPETIEVCIDYIRSEYETFDNYLKHCGVTLHQIQRIKDKLLK